MNADNSGRGQREQREVGNSVWERYSEHLLVAQKGDIFIPTPIKDTRKSKKLDNIGNVNVKEKMSSSDSHSTETALRKSNTMDKSERNYKLFTDVFDEVLDIAVSIEKTTSAFTAKERSSVLNSSMSSEDVEKKIGKLSESIPDVEKLINKNVKVRACLHDLIVDQNKNKIQQPTADLPPVLTNESINTSGNGQSSRNDPSNQTCFDHRSPIGNYQQTDTNVQNPKGFANITSQRDPSNRFEGPQIRSASYLDLNIKTVLSDLDAIQCREKDKSQKSSSQTDMNSVQNKPSKNIELNKNETTSASKSSLQDIAMPLQSSKPPSLEPVSNVGNFQLPPFKEIYTHKLSFTQSDDQRFTNFSSPRFYSEGNNSQNLDVIDTFIPNPSDYSQNQNVGSAVFQSLLDLSKDNTNQNVGMVAPVIQSLPDNQGNTNQSVNAVGAVLQSPSDNRQNLHLEGNSYQNVSLVGQTSLENGPRTATIDPQSRSSLKRPSSYDSQSIHPSKNACMSCLPVTNSDIRTDIPSFVGNENAENVGNLCPNMPMSNYISPTIQSHANLYQSEIPPTSCPNTVCIYNRSSNLDINNLPSFGTPLSTSNMNMAPNFGKIDQMGFQCFDASSSSRPVSSIPDYLQNNILQPTHSGQPTPPYAVQTSMVEELPGPFHASPMSFEEQNNMEQTVGILQNQVQALANDLKPNRKRKATKNNEARLKVIKKMVKKLILFLTFITPVDVKAATFIRRFHDHMYNCQIGVPGDGRCSHCLYFSYVIKHYKGCQNPFCNNIFCELQMKNLVSECFSDATFVRELLTSFGVSEEEMKEIPVLKNQPEPQE